MGDMVFATIVQSIFKWVFLTLIIFIIFTTGDPDIIDGLVSMMMSVK